MKRKCKFAGMLLPALMLILGLTFLSVLSLPAQAAAPALSSTAQKSAVYTGETFTVQVILQPGADVAGMMLTCSYDSALVQCTDITFTNAAGGRVRTSLTTGQAKAVFTSKAEAFSIGSGNIAAFTFKATAPGTAQLQFCASQLCSSSAVLYAEEFAQTLTCSIAQQGKPSALLQSLAFSGGSLQPAFSSSVFEYRMEVPFAVTSVLFDCTPLEPDAAVTQNRKNLGKGGSTTDIVLQVTAADKTKQAYTVHVVRLEKGVSSPDPISVPGAVTTISGGFSGSEGASSLSAGGSGTPAAPLSGSPATGVPQNSFLIFLFGMGAALLCIAGGYFAGVLLPARHRKAAQAKAAAKPQGLKDPPDNKSE